jgi:AcrR family transcriptional regulator
MTPAAQRARPRRLPAAQRRGRILDGAMRVFAERGYEGASMAEIARAGGVTAAVIYDHFASKQELHGALLEEQTDALLAHVGSAVGSAGPESEQRMRVGVDAFFEFVQANPFAWRLIFRDPSADPEIAAVHTRIHQRATEGIAVFLDVSAPEALRGDPHREQTLEMFAQLLKMSLNGMAVWWYEHPSVPRDELVERVLDFCWRGLERTQNKTLRKSKGGN